MGSEGGSRASGNLNTYLTTGSAIFDEARMFGIQRPQEEHRLIDHFFEYDANAEARFLVDRTFLGKRIRISVGWTWMSWDFGFGAELHARKGSWKQQEGDILDAWLNLGPVDLMLEVLDPST